MSRKYKFWTLRVTQQGTVREGLSAHEMFSLLLPGTTASSRFQLDFFEISKPALHLAVALRCMVVWHSMF